MGNNKRRYAAAVLMAGAIALSGCSASTEPAGDTTEAAAPSVSAPAESPAAAPEAAGPKAVKFDDRVLPMDLSDLYTVQLNIAQQWAGKVTENPYSLSGQWTLDGNDSANTAQLWANYFSDGLRAKLTEAGTGDISGIAPWSVMALAPPESSDAIKASPSCTTEFDSCSLIIIHEGSGQLASDMRRESVDQSEPNRVAFDYDFSVPVSLTEHGNAEGILKGLLKVDVTFVPNPTPGDGRAPFLIDSIRNNVVDTNADLASNFPDLHFGGGRNTY